MMDFNIQYGQSTEIFIDGQLNPNLIIEEGCWYLCIDTAELFIGVKTEAGLTLKRINDAESHPVISEVKTKVETVLLPKVEKVEEEIIPTVDDLKTWVENKDYLQDIDLDGYAKETYVDNKVAEIKIPDVSSFATKTELIAAIDAIEHPTTDLSNYVTKDEIGNFIAEVPSEYITESELEAKGYLTQHQDLSHLATKQEIPDVSKFITEVPDEYITEEELTAKGYLTEHQNLDSYATKQDVTDAINSIEIPEVNLSAYSTTAEMQTAITTAIGGKADRILFTASKIVNNPIGGFALGEDVKGLTIADLFAKLLGLTEVDLPDEPGTPGADATSEEIVNYLMANGITMYSQDTSGNLIETPFTNVTWTKTEAAVQMDGTSTIYHIVDESGTVIESGYQEATDYNEVAWLTIALPDVIKSVKVKMFNPGASDWEDVNWVVVQADEQPMEGYIIWTVPEMYEIQSGDTYRFVITD